MSVDGNEVVNKLADQVKNLVVETAQLQVSCDALIRERIDLLNKISVLENENTDLNNQLTEYAEIEEEESC